MEKVEGDEEKVCLLYKYQIKLYIKQDIVMTHNVEMSGVEGGWVCGGGGGALIALGAGFNPILTGREPKGWEACRTSNRRLKRRREGASQNIYINGSVLGLTKTH